MNGHNVTVAGAPGAHWGTCDCGEASPQMHFEWQVEDWTLDHYAEVTRKRTRLRSIRPAVEKPVPDEDQLPLF